MRPARFCAGYSIPASSDILLSNGHSMTAHWVSTIKQIAVVPLLMALCFVQELSSQAQQEPVSTLHSASRLAVLDVVVLDASGKPVRDLTRNDFTILEDGQRQNIASFERPEDHKYMVSTDDKPGSHQSQSVSPALTILVIDGLNTPLLDLIYAREAVAKFLRSQGAALPQPTALMRVTDTQLELLHDYTQDASTLLEALKRHPLELPARSAADSTAVGEGDRLLDSLACLEKIAAANANFAGRKNVIWIGVGFNALNGRTRPGNEIVMSRVANEMRSARLAVYTIDPRGLQVISPGVSAYASDPRGGLQAASASAMEDPSGLRFFENIARETGGRMIFNRNDVDVAVADSVNDGATYYTLSYYPANHDWNGKFRRIRVVLSKPGLEARTRAGYFAVPDALETDTTIDSVLASAVRNPLPYRGLGVSVSFKALPGSPGMARFAVAVDRHDLGWETSPNGDHHCQIMLVAMSVSRKERVVKNDVKEMEAIVRAGKFEAQMGQPMVFSFTGELPPDAARLRVVVRDSRNGRIGTVDIGVDEPASANVKAN